MRKVVRSVHTLDALEALLSYTIIQCVQWEDKVLLLHCTDLRGPIDALHIHGALSSWSDVSRCSYNIFKAE